MSNLSNCFSVSGNNTRVKALRCNGKIAEQKSWGWLLICKTQLAINDISFKDSAYCFLGKNHSARDFSHYFTKKIRMALEAKELRYLYSWQRSDKVENHWRRSSLGIENVPFIKLFFDSFQSAVCLLYFKVTIGFSNSVSWGR